jgi:hypothetical protein
MQQSRLETRLQAVEDKLARLEILLVNLSAKLDTVTEYVSMRLQQLVPHTCEHVPPSFDGQGPYLEGTDVPCTDEVLYRIGRIPIPFVREMVVQRVAQRAREDKVARVDVAFFEQAATF